jgi:DNA-binding LytR/AlgR family response regulator
MTRVLVVDDERPALEDLGRLLETSPGFEDVVLAGGAAEALRLLAEAQFDVVFMDVRMPDIDGLELAKALQRFADPPALVFVSAFEDGAVSVFEHGLQPLDYLMKPVSRARVDQALERLQSDDPERRSRGAGIRSHPPSSPGDRAGGTESGEIIPVEHQRGGATRLLDRATVLYVQAEGDYVRIHADSGRFLVRTALSDIEQRWGEHGFVRVHRSYVANLRRAVEIRPKLGGAVTIVMADGSEVPVARRHVADLRRRLRM